MFTISYDKEKKKERMTKLITFIERFSNNKKAIGYGITIFHIIYVIIAGNIGFIIKNGTPTPAGFIFVPDYKTQKRRIAGFLDLWMESS